MDHQKEYEMQRLRGDISRGLHEAHTLQLTALPALREGKEEYARTYRSVARQNAEDMEVLLQTPHVTIRKLSDFTAELCVELNDSTEVVWTLYARSGETSPEWQYKAISEFEAAAESADPGCIFKSDIGFSHGFARAAMQSGYRNVLLTLHCPELTVVVPKTRYRRILLDIAAHLQKGLK